ncbi:arginyltransferase [Salinivibrio sp. ES.052]|uniref:arginyltransferase n=1 Tax=Salinivibrio sp. ES.052 TaxID=1882823 RepID=UPI000925C737|nr:arginyltransferase [Salinivibrio sp. ES.052]SIN93405.1 arginine-tRNA-protein transferase [Salinivibrio sp. ES.052]
MSVGIQVGVTPISSCQYLADQNEQLAVVLSGDYHQPERYGALLAAGFRRSGNLIYRPHCPQCQACQALRVDVAHYRPSKSQKRHRSQLKRLTLQVSENLDENWFALYDSYITSRHATGNMYPANRQDFLDFISSQWLSPRFIHLYQDEEKGLRLVAVAVIDVVDDGLSALYTFFDPHHAFSLGRVCIQAQIQLAHALHLPWLYLGYQIDACTTMRYKADYYPHQRFINQQWRAFSWTVIPQ